MAAGRPAPLAKSLSLSTTIGLLPSLAQNLSLDPANGAGDDGRWCETSADQGEVKAAGPVRPDDLRGLTYPRDGVGEDLLAGVVLHTGSTVRSPADRLWAGRSTGRGPGRKRATWT